MWIGASLAAAAIKLCAFLINNRFCAAVYVKTCFGELSLWLVSRFLYVPFCRRRCSLSLLDKESILGRMLPQLVLWTRGWWVYEEPKHFFLFHNTVHVNLRTETLSRTTKYFSLYTCSGTLVWKLRPSVEHVNWVFKLGMALFLGKVSLKCDKSSFSDRFLSSSKRKC